MNEYQLTDRVVVEVHGEECTLEQMAAALRAVAEMIEQGRKGGEFPIGNKGDLLWERECADYGFRMGDKSLIGMHYYGSEKKDEFPVITLMREDLEQKGFDTSNLGDEWMEKIASKVGDILLDYDYWDHLVWAAEYYKVPRKEN